MAGWPMSDFLTLFLAVLLALLVAPLAQGYGGRIWGVFRDVRFVQRNGGRLLADLGSLKIPYQGTGLSARRSFVAASPDTVERTLRGFAKANQFLQEKSNQPAVIRSLRKWLRLSASENTDELYERMKSLYDRRISPTREGVQNALRVLSKADPKYGKLKVDDLIDDRIARKLEN